MTSATTLSHPQRRPPLSLLVRQFEQDPPLNQTLIQNALDEGHRLFVEAAIPLLKRDLLHAGTQYVVLLLSVNGLLLDALASPELTETEARTAALTAQSLDPQADVKLARALAGALVTSEGSFDLPAAGRLLEILDAISHNSRISPWLIRLLRHPDPRLRSKAVRMIGRGNTSVCWVRQRLAETDQRVRANAVEALWNVDSEVSRLMLKSMVQDANNRVAGNAVLGLYRLGEAVAVGEAVKMAAHDSPLFRASAAWLMGESGDPRFIEPLGSLMCEQNATIRKRAFSAMQRLKAQISAARPAAACRIVARLVAPDSTGRRRMAVATNALRAGTLLPTHFSLIEDGKAVTSYQVVEQAQPEASAVTFLLPVEETETRWADIVLSCLEEKTRAESWACVRYRSAPTEEAERVIEPEPPPFHTPEGLIRGQFRLRLAPSACTDLWQSLAHALQHGPPVPGSRKMIILHGGGVCGSASPELIAELQKEGADIQVVAAKPSEELKGFCRLVGGHFNVATHPDRLHDLLADAYLALFENYEVQWDPAAANPSEVILRLRSPASCGEVTLALGDEGTP